MGVGVCRVSRNGSAVNARGRRTRAVSVLSCRKIQPTIGTCVRLQRCLCCLYRRGTASVALHSRRDSRLSWRLSGERFTVCTRSRRSTPQRDAADLGTILLHHTPYDCTTLHVVLYTVLHLLRVLRVLDYSSTQRLYFVQVCQLSQVLRLDYLHRGARVVLLRVRQGDTNVHNHPAGSAQQGSPSTG